MNQNEPGNKYGLRLCHAVSYPFDNVLTWSLLKCFCHISPFWKCISIQAYCFLGNIMGEIGKGLIWSADVHMLTYISLWDFTVFPSCSFSMSSAKRKWSLIFIIHIYSWYSYIRCYYVNSKLFDTFWLFSMYKALQSLVYNKMYPQFLWLVEVNINW